MLLSEYTSSGYSTPSFHMRGMGDTLIGQSTSSGCSHLLPLVFLIRTEILQIIREVWSPFWTRFIDSSNVTHLLRFHTMRPIPLLFTDPSEVPPPL